MKAFEVKYNDFGKAIVIADSAEEAISTFRINKPSLPSGLFDDSVEDYKIKSVALINEIVYVSK